MKNLSHLFFLILLFFPLSLASAAVIEKVTTHPGLDYSPSLSSDGRYMAFVSDRGKSHDIWLKDLAAGPFSIPKQITKHPATDRAPMLNLDGSKLLYVSDKTDPRGDIYLLDIFTGKEKKLTDLNTGDSFPIWAEDGNSFYYLKDDYLNNKKGIFKRLITSPKESKKSKDSIEPEEKEIIGKASSFSLGKGGWIVYSDEGKIIAVNENRPKLSYTLTSGEFLDVLPSSLDGKMVYFTRYAEDTNEDGVVDTEDESSIWLTTFDSAATKPQSTYRMTPEGHYHLYPAPFGKYVYFSDIKKGEIQRIDAEEFLSAYSNPAKVIELALGYMDKGQKETGLMMMGNISNNHLYDLNPRERSEFDFQYIKYLIEWEKYDLALKALKKYEGTGGDKETVAGIYKVAANIHKNLKRLSAPDIKRDIKKGVDKIISLGSGSSGSSGQKEKDIIYGTSLIESGNLYLLADEPLTALDYFIKAGELKNTEIRAIALFSRGKVYSILDDQAKLISLFVDAIQMFEPGTFWAKRAVAQAIAVSEKGSDFNEKIFSLRKLIEEYPDLEILSASTSLRISDLYYEQGENLKALETLDFVIKKYNYLSSFVEESYRRQGKIYAASEEFEKAADAYGKLLTIYPKEQENFKKAKESMVLQMAREAEKKRKLGEVKIAAKEFKKILEKYPDSVEAHRGYIQTKVQLGKTDAVQAFYNKLSGKESKNPVYLYGLGLALSYSKPIDFPKIISMLEKAVRMNPGVSYFHQTLGWAYEQFEKTGGARGRLEKAAGEYLAALELNDLILFRDVEANLLLNLGNTYKGLQNFDEAYRFYRNRDSLSMPFNVKTTELIYRKQYGESCFKTGRTEEALKQYTIALNLLSPKDKKLRIEILERIALSYQDLKNYSKAIQYFSESLEINMELGVTKNIALSHRNIGINLYNLSLTEEEIDRPSLKRALNSYFTGLESIEKFGVKGKGEAKGLFQIETALGDSASSAAKGFDRQGEEKMIFGYIASAYENLAEPSSSLKFYLKKLATFPEKLQPDEHAALLTEKAVTLNRIGLLSFQIGKRNDALKYLLESLQITQKLGLEYGKGVNLYNISKILPEIIISPEKVDKTVDIDMIEALVSAFEDYSKNGKKDKNYFYITSNMAFLCYNLPYNLSGRIVSKSSEKFSQKTENFYRLYNLKNRSFSYYSKALKALESIKGFTVEERLSNLIIIKLNMMQITRLAGKINAYGNLLKDIRAVVENRFIENGWLFYLLQAERTYDDKARGILLEKSFEKLFSLPVLAYPTAGIKQFLPFYDDLSQLYTDSLIAKGAYKKAFLVAEQLEMRKISSVLYKEYGSDFFFNGMSDEYKEELTFRLNLMRNIPAGENGKGIENKNEYLNKSYEGFKEVIFALNEEDPVLASFLYQFPADIDVLSQVIKPDAPYIKIVEGRSDLHVFLHDGQNLKYLPVEQKAEGKSDSIKTLLSLQEILSELTSFYLSAPYNKINDKMWNSLLEGKTVTNVNTFYDIVNGANRKGIFYSRGAIAGAFKPDKKLLDSGIAFSFTRLQGEDSIDGDSDREIMNKSNVFISAGQIENFSYVIKKENGVRELLELKAINVAERHTAFLLNLPEDHRDYKDQIRPMISALIRAGFSHVIINNGKYDKKKMGKFVSLYLSYLADLPANEALAQSIHDLSSGKKGKVSLSLYGYAGMDEDEKIKYAASKYSNEIASATTLHKEGDIKGALPHFENALSLADIADKQGDAPMLLQLVVEAAFRIGNYEKALFYQEKLLSTLLSSLNQENKEKISAALYTMGIINSRLEHYEQAVSHINKAIKIWSETEELDRLADSISTLGVVKENMGAYSEALKSFDNSFKLYQDIGEIADMAAQYRKMGRINYLRLGRYEKARENFNHAYEIYTKLEDRKGRAESLFEIGLTYEKMGLFAEADKKYQAGKLIGEELNNHYLIATGRLYLANTAWFRGEYQKSLTYLSAAHESAEKIEDTQLIIMIENTRGLLYWTLNDTEKGLMHIKKAVRLSEKEDIKTELSSSLNNFGLLYRQKGELEDSLKLFKKAEEIDKHLKSKWGLAYDYRNIGISAMRLGRLKEAEKNFIKAEKISAEIQNNINHVKSLLELGNVNMAMKKHNKAVEYYDKAYNLSKQFGIKEVQWRAAAGNAYLLRLMGEKDESLERYAESVNIVEKMRAELKIDQLRNSFQNNKVDLYKDIITLLVEMGRTEDAFNYLERSRSRSFIDLLGNQKIDLKNDLDEKEMTGVKQLFIKMETLAREISTYKTPPSDLKERYIQAKNIYEEALINLKQRNPQLSSFVSVDPLKLQEFEKMLKPGIGVLSYMLADKQIYIWLVKQNSTKFYKVKKEKKEIIELIKRYRFLVQRIEPVESELKMLYDLLIKPVKKDLAGLKYLGIIPDGPLHYLSFAALKGEKGYIIDEFPLFYSPSASVFKYTLVKKEGKKQTKVLAIGNPDLGDFNYDLPLAELEAKSIRWSFPDIDLLTGSKANKEWIISNISKYGIIHIASHGEFNDINPLLSSLMLAAENPEDGRLSVKEVFSLDINADIVTLSACQTGLGKLEGGEIIGLNRAFIYAGTHSIISSLWRVDDLSTAVLMKHFYRNYVTHNKSNSLRQAQLLVKKSFPHPSYWAGFNLVGNYN